MAKRKLGIGIRENATMRIIGGAKVLFDPRTTAEVCESRDDKNWKANDKAFRTALWKERQKEQQAA